MEFLQNLLPIIIYFLLIGLLIVGIVLGIKTIIALSKMEKVIDDVNEKMEKLNPIFSFIDFTSTKITSVADKIADLAGSAIGKLFSKKKSRKELKNEEDD